MAPVLAEFLGTATLVSAALVITETTDVSYYIGTSLALTLSAVYLIFASVSGGHFNPAITFGMWVTRRIGTLRAVGYVAAQMLGGLVAWQLYEYLTGRPVLPKDPTFSGPLWAAEAVGTFILALAFSAAAASRVINALQSAVVYGASLFVALMVASATSIAFLNPAMALGLRSWGTAYVLGPLVGGLVGVSLYWLVFDANSPRVALRSLRTSSVRTTKTVKVTKTSSRKAPVRKRSSRK
jgi:aquaporin Z